MGCSIFKSLPLPSPHPTPPLPEKNPTAIASLPLSPEPRTAPAGRPLTGLLLSSQRKEGFLPAQGPATPGRCSGSASELAGELGSRPGAGSLLTASRVSPREPCTSVLEPAGGSHLQHRLRSEGTPAGLLGHPRWETPPPEPDVGRDRPKCCQTDRILGSAILAWIWG